MLPSVTISRNQVTYLVFVVLLLAIPLTVDELGKRSFVAGMGLGVVFLILAIFVYLRGRYGKTRHSRATGLSGPDPGILPSFLSYRFSVVAEEGGPRPRSTVPSRSKSSSRTAFKDRLWIIEAGRYVG